MTLTNDGSFLNRPGRRQVSETSLTGLGIAQPRKVSRLNSRFTLVDDLGNKIPVTSFDPQLGVYIDMIVVDANPHKSKIYYDQSLPYDPNREDPPLCWSDNGVAPSVNALQPQSMRCDQCPQNVKGSAIGREGKEVWACRDQKKLAVLIAGYEGIWLFVVPPASLKNYRNHVQYIATQALPGAGRNADVADVITRAYFSKDEPNVVEFGLMGLITPAIAAYQDKLWQTDECRAIVGANDQPRTLALPENQRTLALPENQRTPPHGLGGQPMGFQHQEAPRVAPPPPPQPVPSAAPSASAFMTPSPQGSTQSSAAPAVAGNGQQTRRRRTKAEMEAARGAAALLSHAAQQGQQSLPTAPQPDPLDIPEFMRRTPAPPAPVAPPQTQPVQPQFGIAQQAADPSAEIARAVDAAFKLT